MKKMINNINLSEPLFKPVAKKLLIKNGTVIDAYAEKEFESDILIINGVIEKIAQSIKAEKGCEVIDAKGMYISAGFFDMHVHLREPGYEQAENIVSGTNAAMSGGITGLAAMANTTPCVDNKFILKDIQSRSKELLVTVHQIPAVTIKREGKVLAEMTELAENGALAFSDDGNGIQSSETMKGALEYAKMFGTPILVHPEDHSFTEGVMNESFTSTELGMSYIPAIAESINIARDIEIARYVDGKVHFQHVSAKESVELIRKAKKEKLKITCEVTPHHFSLTDDKVRTFSTDYKMNPPLRTQEDVDAIHKALKDGIIDVIATDHAPHPSEKKNVEFDFAPFGVLGLETMFSAGITYLVKPKKLSLMEFLKKITVNPRKILNLEPDLLKKGRTAEITIFDQNKKWKVDRRKLKSLSLNTCFHDDTHYGKVLYTINNGKIFKA
ncbi:MAG: dihydroorotase [Candidatus Delongbacteria bacterium]|nr:dihydroorotase [Candidatus Delongbacteria bacterium]MCG2760867.1 dihydroorotase [Candidatus Delongbacteria bacterium]